MTERHTFTDNQEIKRAVATYGFAMPVPTTAIIFHSKALVLFTAERAAYMDECESVPLFQKSYQVGIPRLFNCSFVNNHIVLLKYQCPGLACAPGLSVPALVFRAVAA